MSGAATATATGVAERARTLTVRGHEEHYQKQRSHRIAASIPILDARSSVLRCAPTRQYCDCALCGFATVTAVAIAMRCNPSGRDPYTLARTRRPRPLRCGVSVPYRQLLRPRSVGEAKVARLAKRSASRSASRSRSRDRDRTRDKERSPASEKPRMPVATADAEKRRVARSESRSRSRERDRRERDRERDKREKARDRGRDAGAGRSGDADERAPAVEADGSQSASGKRVNREAGASDEEGGTEASRASAKRLKKEKKREARRAEKEKEKAEKEKRARPRSLASFATAAPFMYLPPIYSRHSESPAAGMEDVVPCLSGISEGSGWKCGAL